MSTTQNRLADVMRRRFEATGWSVKRLADVSGVPYSSVHRFLRGRTSIDLGTADKLCRTLGLRLVPVPR